VVQWNLSNLMAQCKLQSCYCTKALVSWGMSSEIMRVLLFQYHYPRINYLYWQYTFGARNIDLTLYMRQAYMAFIDQILLPTSPLHTPLSYPIIISSLHSTICDLLSSHSSHILHSFCPPLPSNTPLLPLSHPLSSTLFLSPYQPLLHLHSPPSPLFSMAVVSMQDL